MVLFEHLHYYVINQNAVAVLTPNGYVLVYHMHNQFVANAAIEGSEFKEYLILNSFIYAKMINECHFYANVANVARREQISFRANDAVH